MIANWLSLPFLPFTLLAAIGSNGCQSPHSPTDAEAAFESASEGSWEPVFMDAFTGDWQEQWFLDGEVGTATSSPAGTELRAGPEFGDDAHHMVLWTKQTFEGDLKIEYEYTRTDTETRCVNILYIQATGEGPPPYFEDISAWNDLRQVPAMRTYFYHMHTYHISYAAFPNNEDDTSYIRGRRYIPGGDGLEGTGLEPDYFPEGLFATGVPHRITVIKRSRDLYMKVSNPDGTQYFHLKNVDLPEITSGRIGLRHMFTRSARYKNFKVSFPSQ